MMQTLYKSFILLLGLIFGLVNITLAQPPNDDLCNAEVLGLGASCVVGNNTGATAQIGEPNPSCFTGDLLSVWYQFTAPSSGEVVISTSTNAVINPLDTEIALYRLSGGNCNALTDLSIIDCNDNYNEDDGNFQGVILADSLISGEIYYVQVSGKFDFEDEFCIEIYEPGLPIIFVDDDANGANDGTSWINAYNDLQDALAVSGTEKIGQIIEIWIAGGTYTPTDINDRIISFDLDDSNIKLYGGFAGTEAMLSERLTDSLNLHQINETILSGEIGNPNDIDDNSNHILYVDNGATVLLDGLTIKSAYSDSVGSGIFVQFSDLTINDCILNENEANGEGGGIYGFGSSLVVENSLFDSNYANGGAGIFIDEVDTKILNTHFINNYGLDGGGGIYVFVCDNILIEDCSFESNTSEFNRGGGGAFFEDSEALLRGVLFASNITGGDGAGIATLRSSLTIKSNEFLMNEANGFDGGEGGGGIYADASIIDYDSCLFEANKSPIFGGAIFNNGSFGSISNCVFRSNTCERGGAITNALSSPEINGCLFIENEGAFGGAVHNFAFSAPRFNSCQFIHNEAFDGGADNSFAGCRPVYTDCDFEQNISFERGGALFGIRSDIIVNNCRFFDNLSEEFGGAIFISDSSILDIQYSQFSRDSSQLEGGAILVEGGSQLNIQNSSLWENYSDLVAGAIYMNQSQANISNSTLSGNEAGTRGGAIACYSSNLRIESSTIYENQAIQGSAFLRSNSPISLLNTVLANEIGNNIENEPGPKAPMTSLGYNFVDDTTGAFLIPQTSDQLGNNLNPIDPLLDGLVNNNGLSPYHTPLPNSPLLAQGIPLVDLLGGPSLIDQRGFSRTIGNPQNQIDIGAYNAQTSYVLPPNLALCQGDQQFLRLESILIQDSTGGGSDIGDNQNLILSLPTGLQFNPTASHEVKLEGSGYQNAQLTVTSDQLTIDFDRVYDTLFNNIQIRGLEIIADASTNPGSYELIRTGGNASLIGQAIEDSIVYARMTVLPNFKLADAPYDQSFEGTDAFWLPDREASLWERGIPDGETINTAASGEEVWMTGLSQKYLPNDTSWLGSPCFDFRGLSNPILGISIWSDTESGLDGTVLQSSTDRGKSWQTIGDDQLNPSLNWYNSKSILSNPGQQSIGQQYGWTGGDENWKSAKIPLLGLNDSTNVRFRFAFGSIPIVDTIAKSNNGFAFDDFFISEGGQKKTLFERFTNSGMAANPQRIDSILSQNADVVTPIDFHLEGELFDANPVGPVARGFFYGVSEAGYSIINGNGFLGSTDEITENDFVASIISEARMEIIIDTLNSPNLSITSTRDIPEEVVVYMVIIEKNSLNQSIFRAFIGSAAGQSEFDWKTSETRSFTPIWDENSFMSPSEVKITEYDSLRLIVFVQNRFTKEVYQVAQQKVWSGLLDPAALREGGFAERLDPELRIYPNPANYELNLDFGQVMEDDLQVRLTDMQGRPVQQRSLNPGKAFYKVDLQKLSAGMYYLELYNRENSIHRQKIVVRH